MKYLLLLTLTYCLLPNQVMSNNSLTNDSNLEEPSLDEKEITETINKAEQLRNSSYDKSIAIGKQALDLALATDNASILATTYKSLGTSYLYQGVFDSAQFYYEKSLIEFKQVGDSLNIGKVNGNLGIVYRRTEQFDKAVQHYLKSLRIYKDLNYKKGIGGAYLNIGGLHHTLFFPDKALAFYQKALEIYEELDDDKRLSSILTNMGVLQTELKNNKKALSYHLRALDLNSKTKDTSLRSIILMNIGQSYQAVGQPNKALGYYNESEDLRIQLHDLYGISKVYLLKAKVYTELNKNTQAVDYFNKSIQICIDNNLQEGLRESYFHYSKFLEKSNPRQAIEYLKKHHRIKDSLILIFQNKAVRKLTTKFESAQQAKELKLLTQKSQIQNLELGKKNSWIVLLMTVLILGGLAIFVSIRINHLRVDHKIMDLRQKVLLTQMNPHFLFNSLTAIQSFILDNKNKEANNYLSRLASLVRGILENSREEFVSLHTELETLKDYIGLQKLRFENEINYEFVIDKNIDPDQVLVPPMLAQPFVENALIHGMLRNNPHALIQIKVMLNEDMDSLCFQIKDNGIGLDEAKKNRENKDHKSIATSIALDRVKIYNFKSSKKMKFEIIDLKNIGADQSGTQVIYTIPLNITD